LGHIWTFLRARDLREDAYQPHLVRTTVKVSQNSVHDMSQAQGVFWGCFDPLLSACFAPLIWPVSGLCRARPENTVK